MILSGAMLWSFGGNLFCGEARKVMTHNILSPCEQLSTLNLINNSKSDNSLS